MATAGGINGAVSRASIPQAGAAELLQGQIQSACGQLEGLAQDLQALVAELQLLSQQMADLQGQRPVKGQDEKDADFQKRLGAWQDQVNAVQAQIAGLMGRIQDKQQAVDRKQGELAGLQARMPAARADDERRIAAANEAARKAAESLGSALDPKADPADDDQARAKKRERVFKPGAPRGGGIPSGGVP